MEAYPQINLISMYDCYIKLECNYLLAYIHHYE